MRRIFILAFSTWWSISCLSASMAVCAVAPAANSELDDPVEPLAPEKARTEEEEDHLKALALFSTARTMEQRQELPQALRHYQRALRYDPQSLSALREMVPLAFSMNRPDEGLRYAAKFAQENTVEPTLLRYSAAYLAESGDWKGAIKLYEQMEQLLAKQKPSAEQVLLEMDLGRLYFLSERFADAAGAFEHVAEALDKPKQFGLDATMRKDLLGDDGATYELMGNVFVEAKKPEQAKHAFEEFNKLKPDAALLALNMARVESAADHPQAALDELQKYFDAKATSQGAAAYEFLATVLKQLNQSDQLISRLEALRKNQPENAPLAYYLGEQYRQTDKLDKAQELLEAALTSKPSPQIYRALVNVYRRTNQPEALLKVLGKMAEENGALELSDEEAKQLIGNEKLLGAILELAQKQHDAGATEDPHALRAAALLAVASKRWNDAEKLMNLAIKAQPKATVDLLTIWGLGLLLDEKYPEAAKVFQRGIDEKSDGDDLAPLYFYLAGALELQNKTDDALVAAKKAAEERQKDPRFVARPAWILYHAKRYADAEKAYKEFVDQFDTDYTTPEVRESLREARSVLSNLAEERHDMRQAVEWLEQVLDERPDDAGANNDLGFLWADENQHLRRAYRMIQVAVTDSPDNAAYRDSLGWVLYRLNRYSEALTELQKAAAGENPDGEILNHLGDAYSKLGQNGEAKAAWTRALEGFKKASESEKIKDVEKKLADSEKMTKSE